MLDSTGSLLTALHRAQRAVLAVELAPLGLHPGAELALAQLWFDEGISPSQLALRLRITRAGVTKLTRTLEAAGLVERRPDPEDGRASRLYPTAAARALRPQVERAWHEAEREALRRLSARERRELHRLLERALSDVR